MNCDSYFDILSHTFDNHPRLISTNNIELQKYQTFALDLLETSSHPSELLSAMHE